MTTLNLQVSSDADDGYWQTANSNFTQAISRLYFGDVGGGAASNLFARFTGVSIPAGATITSATLGLLGNGEASGNPAMVITAEKAASAAQLTGYADADSRAVTTASVNWTAALTNGSFVQSPDISAVIQELVNAYGVTLTTIQILMKCPSPGGVYHVAWSYGHAPADAPTLTVTYTVGGVPFSVSEVGLMNGGIDAKAGGMQ